MSVGFQTNKVHDVGSLGFQKTEQTQAKTDGVKVGKQDNAQGAQTPKGHPGITAALKKSSEVRSSDALKLDQFSTALAPSKGFKAKAAFVGFFQKILPNSLASRIGQDSATPLREARQALASFHAATTPGDKETALTTLRDALSRLPEGSVRNRNEMLNVVEGELRTVDFGKRMDALKNDNSPTAPQKHLDLALEMLKFPHEFRAQSEAGNFRSDMELQFQEQVRLAETKGRQHGDTGVHQRLMGELSKASQSEATTHAEHPQQIFRGTNENSALMRACNYASLPSRWDHSIQNSIETFGRHGNILEMVPSRIKPEDLQGSTAEEVAKKNAEALIGVYKQFMSEVGMSGDALLTQNAVDRLPQELCDSMRAVYEGLKGTHGDAEALRQVGSNMFLRMLCPMLTSPRGGGPTQPHSVIGKDETITPSTQKNLIFLSKLLQNTANQVEFGEKEKSMEVFNDAVKDHFGAITMFARLAIDRGRSPNEI